MSNLPHPLGDSVAGDLFYPGTPSVTASDAAGPAGSRAVEYGEDGTSAAVNRGLYALGKNDEYIQARMEQAFARPTFLSFTPAGGNGGNYTFSAVVWCGDSAYTPEDQNFRNGLIAVLDEDYNELTEPVSGDRIVVKEILDAPAGTTQVGNGFVTNPYIVFRRQNPVTGALGADYTIPDATVVRLAYGQSATLDVLTTDGNVQDAWFRGWTRSVSELPAGVFYRDGSRPMLGNLDLNDYNLLNADEIHNVSGNPLDIISDDALGLSSGAAMALASSGALTLKDQYLSSGLALSETGETAADSSKSIVGQMNNDYAILKTLQGDMLLNRTGSISFTGATGQIDYPELVYTYQGIRKVTAAGNVTATATTDEHLVLDPSTGAVSLASNAAGIQDKILLTKHYWDGVSSFTTRVDTRYALTGRSRAGEIVCGASNHDGADTADFQDALDMAVNAVFLGTELRSNIPTIRVVGDIYVSGEVTVHCPVKIVGDQSAILRIDVGDELSGIDCQGHTVIVEDVEVNLEAGTQLVGKGAIENAGANSVFRNVRLTTGGATWRNGFVWSSGSEDGVILDGCRGVVQETFFLGSSADRSSAYTTNTMILNSEVTGCLVGVLHPGAGCMIQNCRVSISSGGEAAANVGNSARVTNLIVQGSVTASNQVGVIGYAASAHLDIVINGCSFDNVRAGISFDFNGSVYDLNAEISGCRFFDSEYGISIHSDGWNSNGIENWDDADSAISISGCLFANISVQSIRSTTLEDVMVSNCHFSNQGGIPIFLDNTGGIKLANSVIEGYGSLATDAAIYANWEFGDPAPHTVITGCKIYADGAHADSSQVYLQRPATIDGNLIIGAVKRGVWSIFTLLFDFGLVNTISDNAFGLQTESAVLLSGYVYNGSRITGNRFADLPVNSAGVRLIDAGGVMIANNEFNNIVGNGIYTTATGDGGVNNVHIVENHFENVQGADTTNDRFGAIYVYDGGFDAANRIVIADNILRGCGYESVSTSDYQAVIYTNGNYANVSNNIVDGLTGGNSPSTLSDTSSGIHVQGDNATIIGNKVIKDFAVAAKVANRFFGLWVNGDHAIVEGNAIDFFGTQTDADPTTICTALHCGTETYLQLANNRTGNWALPGSPTNEAIHATGDWVFANNNISQRYNQDYSTGTGGNIISCAAFTSPASVGVGAGRSNTVYNINTP